MVGCGLVRLALPLSAPWTGADGPSPVLTHRRGGAGTEVEGSDVASGPGGGTNWQAMAFVSHGGESGAAIAPDFNSVRVRHVGIAA